MLNPSQEQEEKWARDRRYHFARFCWAYKNKKAPKSKLTWGQVFERKEGISLNYYANSKMKEKLHSR